MNIVVSNVKGGVGKTTTSVYLAAAAVERGWEPVLLVDSDRQASSAEWLEESPVEGVELVEAPRSGRWPAHWPPPTGLVVVDTPPGDERIVRAAMDRADAVVMPTRAGGVEYSRVLATLEMINARTPHGLVICAARLGTNDLEEAIAWWSDSKVPIWGIVPERVGLPPARRPGFSAKASTPTVPCSKKPFARDRADFGPPGPQAPRPSAAEIAGSGGDIDGMLLEHGQGDDLQCTLVGGGQDHIGGGTVMVGPKPVGRGHTPSITGHQAGKSELGHRGDQVVPDGALMLQEFGGHDRTDGVAAEILRAGVAAPVPVEAGEGIGAARLQ